ncbi:MAG: VCBS repeat-containing protein [Ruminococcaceae bacterium]|nr:VCBS repeat-containing protein [Oscillospiraceae bacterium]
MRNKGRYWALCALLGATVLLGGCMPGSFDDSLYRLPKLPTEYESLETLIDALLESGAEYAAPTSGSNLQSVQMVDLDGDGEEEAVACFRRANDERPMKIYVFRAAGDSYEQYCVLEGTSHSIYSINYIDLNGDGWREILAGIRSDLDVQNLAIYSVASGEGKQLLVTGYTRYAAQDMDGDGRQDLIVLRSDEESSAVADYYAWDDAELTLRSSLRLSSTVAELMRVTAGTLEDGKNALFVTSVAEDSLAVTDVVVVDDGMLRNLTGSGSGEPYRFLELYPTDVNGDGVTEVPEPTPFPQTDPEAPVYYRIRWRQYKASGDSAIVQETFQDTQGGWSLLLPENWGRNVTVSRASSADGSTVTFTRLDRTEPEPFLTIHAFTGYNRTALASRSGRILLSRQAEVTYAAELYNDSEDLIDEASLRESFSLIAAEWATGEN